MLASPLEDRVLLHLKVGFSLPPLVNGQTPGLKRTRPRHTTRRDNLVHLGHEVAVIDRRQLQLENDIRRKLTLPYLRPYHRRYPSPHRYVGLLWL
jgi:hypothetical protein